MSLTGWIFFIQAKILLYVLRLGLLVLRGSQCLPRLSLVVNTWRFGLFDPIGLICCWCKPLAWASIICTGCSSCDSTQTQSAAARIVQDTKQGLTHVCYSELLNSI